MTVVEGKHRRLQLAAGYGSEEKARGRVNWRHVNFTGGARTIDTEAKWSSLEHGVRASFTEPYLFRGTSARVTGSSWWASEPAYTYRSRGGRIILTKQLTRGSAGVARSIRNELHVSLIREYENYQIAKTALEDLSIRDQLIALGLNPVTGRGTGTLSAFGRRLRPRHVGAAARSAPRISHFSPFRKRRVVIRGQLQVSRAARRRPQVLRSRTTLRLGQSRPRRNDCRTRQRGHSVLQTVLRGRIDERTRMGPISDQPVVERPADRRPDDDGGVDRGEVWRAR